LGQAIEDARPCPACKGTGSYGRIGVHEVLDASHLFDSSIKHSSMYEAGLQYVKAGLIKEVDLQSEVGTWH
jgi:type II secretory ATPase GspE/PulE/Tfp pilus assembly ATPase PilB-like protein